MHDLRPVKIETSRQATYAFATVGLSAHVDKRAVALLKLHTNLEQSSL